MGGGITTLVAAGGGITITGSGVSRTLTVDLTALATSASVTTLLANYVLASAYNTAMASKIDSVTVTAPLVVSGTGTSRALSTLWKPSQLTLGTGLFGLASDTLGTYALSLTGTESRSALTLQDTNAATRDLTSDTSGNLLWNSAQVALDSQLASKQDNLTAGTNISIVGNTISAAAGATQAWVTANFLSPLNQGTVGVLPGLQSTMTANTWIIGLDHPLDKRLAFNILDSNNVSRSLTGDTSGKILYDSAPLATETQLATKQDTLTAGTGISLSGTTISSYNLPAVQQSVGIPLLAPTHMPPRVGHGTWTDNGTDATISVGQNPPVGQEHWNLYSCPANDTITFSMDVKLGTATNVVLLWWTEMGTVQVFDASNGLNTSTFTKCSCTYTNGTASAVSRDWTIGNYWDTNTLAWNTTQTSGTLIVDNFTVTTGSNTVVAVSGDLSVTGSITGSTKSFLIPSPVPSRSDTHCLRHWCIEGDQAGGGVMYRRTLYCQKGNNILTMPSWFEFLCKDVICFSSPAGHHFGLSWAAQNEDEPNQIVIGASKEGNYNILITASRNDHCATKICPQEVEYCVVPEIIEEKKEP